MDASAEDGVKGGESRGSPRPGRGGGGGFRAIAALLGVVVATALVAVGTTGVGFLRPPATLDEGWVRTVRMVGAAVALLGLVALLVQRRRLRSEGERGRDPTVTALLAATTMMGLLTLIALFAPSVGVEGGGGQAGGSAGPGGTRINPEAAPTTPPPPPSRTAPLTEGAAVGEDREEPEWQVAEEAGVDSLDRRDAGFDWGGLAPWSLLLLGALLAAVVVIAALLVRRRLEHRPEETLDEPPAGASDRETDRHAFPGEIAYEGSDPRGHVTAAYHRLLAALAAVDAPREPQEAPHEHLRRVLGPLGVRSEPMHRLAELYVAAQFSERPLTEEHRADAAEALENGLARLAALRDAPGPDGPGPDPAETRR